jgi:hypothetical protein
MATTVQSKGVPVWFWVVAVLSLLWEAIGCFMYVQQMSMSADQFAGLPQAQQDVWTQTPGWAVAAYAVAVWSGLAGAIGLLLRKAWSRAFFVLSLLGIVVQFGTVFLTTDIVAAMGPAQAMGFPVFIFVVGVGLVWFSGFAAKRGWIA